MKRGSRSMAWRPSPSYQLRIPGCGLGNLAPTSVPASSPVALVELEGEGSRLQGPSVTHSIGAEAREKSLSQRATARSQGGKLWSLSLYSQETEGVWLLQSWRAVFSGAQGGRSCSNLESMVGWVGKVGKVVGCGTWEAG